MLADVAVGYEPVSTWNSLLSADLQGNFRKMTGFAEFWSSIVLQFQSVTAKFPFMGAGNFLELAGKLQGNLEDAGIQPADEQLRSVDSDRKLHARSL